MWRRSVRATHLERARQLSGDALIPEPIASITHAATIRRPPRDVWPWLIQMGAGTRAGWYSFYGLPHWIGMPIVRFGHAIMERKQLLGIASRAESREPGTRGNGAAA